MSILIRPICDSKNKALANPGITTLYGGTRAYLRMRFVRIARIDDFDLC